MHKSDKNPRVAYIVFPDEQAVVKILEILHPFSVAQKDLILHCVAATQACGYPRVRTTALGGWLRHFRKVVSATPLASFIGSRPKRRNV